MSKLFSQEPQRGQREEAEAQLHMRLLQQTDAKLAGLAARLDSFQADLNEISQPRAGWFIPACLFLLLGAAGGYAYSKTLAAPSVAEDPANDEPVAKIPGPGSALVPPERLIQPVVPRSERLASAVPLEPVKMQPAARPVEPPKASPNRQPVLPPAPVIAPAELLPPTSTGRKAPRPISESARAMPAPEPSSIPPAVPPVVMKPVTLQPIAPRVAPQPRATDAVQTKDAARDADAVKSTEAAEAAEALKKADAVKATAAPVQLPPPAPTKQSVKPAPPLRRPVTRAPAPIVPQEPPAAISPPPAPAEAAAPASPAAPVPPPNDGRIRI